MVGEAQCRGLVLGGSGFLGAQVVRLAVEAGFEVTNACRHPERSPAFARGGARELAFDLLGLDSVPVFLDRCAPGWIVNCAAASSAAACERDPHGAFRLNVLLPGILQEWCDRNAARLVHVSTDLVFDGEPDRPAGFREEDRPRPRSAYGRTKRLGEFRVRRKAAVVRLPLLFGDSGGRALGASDSVIAAVERGETPTLFRDELRTPLDVKEAAAALLEIAGRGHTGLLHVAGPRSLSRLELGLLALRSTGRSEREAAERVRSALQAEVDTGSARPRDVSLDSSLARSLLKTRLSWPEERLRPPAG